MTKFNSWCKTNEKVVGTHALSLLSAIASKIQTGKAGLAAVIPTHYVSDERLLKILEKYGKKKAAAFLRKKLPESISSRSGELGEILAVAYVTERTDYQVPIKRLRWKDHREMAMRGDDLIALKTNTDGDLDVLKGEVKSREAMSASVIAEARKTLRDHSNRPSPHTLSFISDRLHELGQDELADRIDEGQLNRTISLSQVEHMIFSVSGNDASSILENDLKAYTGKVRQHSVALRIEQHQKFIADTYNTVK